jgi:cytochrome c553
LRKTAAIAGLIIGLTSPMIICAAEATSPTDNMMSRQTHIRTLAASCAACHGTNGNSAGTTPSISHIEESTFVSQMLAFKSGDRPATVMHRHAKGLSNQEIEDLAEYFSKQKRQTVQTIPSQHLSKDYPH